MTTHLSHRLRPLWLGALSCAALLACQDDNGTDGTPDPSDIGADASADTGDDAIGVDAPSEDTGDDTVVVPPEPFLVLAEVAPNAAFYRSGADISVTATVLSREGVRMDATLAWTVEPEGAAVQGAAVWELVQAGQVTFTGCVEDAPDVCGEAVVWVDDAPPELEVTSPAPGAQLLAEEDPMIVVEGTIRDDGGTASVFVNGVAATIDGETFTAEVRPRYGINHIIVEATDNRWPTGVRTGLDVMWAGEYVVPFDPAAEGALDRIEDHFPMGMGLTVNQNMLDDGSPWIFVPERPTQRARDVAGVVEMLFTFADVMSQVPDPVVDSDELTLRITNLDLGVPEVDLGFTNDGLELYLALDSIAASTEGLLDLGDASVNLLGTIGASIAAEITIELIKPSRDVPLEANVTSVQIALIDASSSFKEPEANAVFAVAEGLLFSVVEATLLDAVRPTIEEAVPPVIEDVFESIDGALVGVELPLDIGFGDPITLRVDAPFDAIDITRNRGMVATVSPTFSVDAARQWPVSRGVAATGRAPAPVLPNNRIGLSVELNTINGLLHAFWDAGLLNLDVTDVIPDAIGFLVDSVRIDGWLPPLVTAPERELERYDAQITVGQLHLVLGRGDQTDVVGVNLSAAVGVNVRDGEATVLVEEEPTIDTWLISSDGDQPIFSDVQALEGLIVGALWPELTDGLTDNLVFEVPSVDASAAGEVAPALSDMVIEFNLSEAPTVRGNTLTVGMAIEAVATTPSE